MLLMLTLSLIPEEFPSVTPAPADSAVITVGRGACATDGPVERGDSMLVIAPVFPGPATTGAAGTGATAIIVGVPPVLMLCLEDWSPTPTDFGVAPEGEKEGSCGRCIGTDGSVADSRVAMAVRGRGEEGRG